MNIFSLFEFLIFCVIKEQTPVTVLTIQTLKIPEVFQNSKLENNKQSKRLHIRANPRWRTEEIKAKPPDRQTESAGKWQISAHLLDYLDCGETASSSHCYFVQIRVVNSIDKAVMDHS